MPDASVLITFIVASVAILFVPGPTVTVIIANSLKYGARAGLWNIAGTQVGLTILLVILALGFQAITTTMAWLFEWLRYVGAAYLVWLGYKLLRANGNLGEAKPGEKQKNGWGYFWQGFLVILSNPKVLFFFGAFLPQFIDPTGSAALQTMAYGLLFMALATTLDSAYAIAAGKAGNLLTKRNVRAVEIGGGSMMMAGGVWLALSRN